MCGSTRCPASLWLGTRCPPQVWVGKPGWLTVLPLSPGPPLLAEFFIDGLGSLLVGSCPEVTVQHQSRSPDKDPEMAAMEESYSKYRANTNAQVQFKLALHYFKNHLQCST